MALPRPVLLSTNPFDATKAHTFVFTSSGSGANIVSNVLTIRENATFSIVYSETEISYEYRHTVPANRLKNGTVYTASVVTKGSDGAQSEPSNQIVFLCLETPILGFTNIPANNTIDNNSFQFNLQYNQANGELLDSVIFNLYNISGELISTSGELNNFPVIPATASYLFSGFKNNTEYYVEAIGQTVNGMQLSTGNVLLIVSYIDDTLYSKLNLVNNCNGGYVTISTSVIAIVGNSNPSPPVYINNDSVDLRASGSWVDFDSGYSFRSNEFTAKIWGNRFTLNSRILKMSTVDGRLLTVEYKTDDNVNAYAELTVYGKSPTKYLADSNVIPIPSNTNQIFVMLRSIGGVYSINLYDRGVGA